MLEVLAVIGVALGALALVHALWWCTLALVSLPPYRRPANRTDVNEMTFAVVVPAHNEAALIGACVTSLARAARAYRGYVRIVVVADNCDDDTARIAASHGAKVLERENREVRGKSYALDHGVAWLRAWAQPPDVVAFVDADSEVSPEFFAAIAARVASGARVVQVHYAAGPGEETVRKLRRLAFALIHYVRPLAMSRLGLGTSLKGSGMAYRWEVARDGLRGAGITEDAAMTLHLARQGIVVQFEGGATVTGFMASDLASARVQDERWELGRLLLARRALTATAATVVRGRFAAAAGAAEVLSLSLVESLVLACVSASILAIVAPTSAWVGLAAIAMLAAYVAIGLVGARVGWSDAQALATAPRFVAYKLSVFARLPLRVRKQAWTRTARPGTESPGEQ